MSVLSGPRLSQHRQSNWYIYNKSKQNRLEVPFSPVIMDDKNDGYQKKFPDPPG